MSVHLPQLETRSLPEIRDALLALPHPFQRSTVHSVVKNLRPQCEYLDPYLNFSERGYTRTQFYKGPRFEILVLCWREGQASPIHDHAESICTMAVVKGTCTVENFRGTCEGNPVLDGKPVKIPLVETKNETLEPGTVITVEGGDIHRIANHQGDGRDLVTIHFYLPPIETMRCFDRHTDLCRITRPETLLPRP